MWPLLCNVALELSFPKNRSITIKGLTKKSYHFWAWSWNSAKKILNITFSPDLIKAFIKKVPWEQKIYWWNNTISKFEKKHIFLEAMCSLELCNIFLNKLLCDTIKWCWCVILVCFVKVQCSLHRWGCAGNWFVAVLRCMCNTKIQIYTERV